MTAYSVGSSTCICGHLYSFIKDLRNKEHCINVTGPKQNIFQILSPDMVVNQIFQGCRNLQFKTSFNCLCIYICTMKNL